jgi:cytochrome c oxidase cbb3-type subunit 3
MPAIGSLAARRRIPLPIAARYRSRVPFLAALLVALLHRSPTPPPQRAPTPIARDSLSRFDRAKAESLLRERLPCLGCHRLGDEGGRIGPDLSDVAARRSPEYIARMVADPQRTVPGSMMPRTPMPEPMRALVVRYLAERAGGRAAPGGPPPTGESTARTADSTDPSNARLIESSRAGSRPVELRGDVLYSRYCAACHGEKGEGDGPNARYLPIKPAVHASKEAMSRRPDDSLFDAIAAGGYVMGKSVRMPAFGETLTREQIRALVRHIRSLCRCEGPRWSTDGTR